MSLLAKRLAWGRLVRSGRQTGLKLAVLASYTIEPVVPALGVALEDAGLSSEIHVGPYDQIAPQCLADDSETATLAPDVIVVHARLEELWAGLGTPLDGPIEAYVAEARTIASIARAAAQRWGATLLLVLPALPEALPLGVGDANNPAGVDATAAACRAAMREAAGPAALIVDLERIVRALGSENAHAPALWAAAKIPYADATFDRLGEQIARLVTLSRRGARKVIALDADHTLWGGVVGEDGPGALKLGGSGVGAAFAAFQRHMLAMREAGALLALVSKNEEADVWAGFDRPEMVLRREHFAAWRINWERKSANLAAIAAELNVGLDALVLIDDNPAELAEVEAVHPEIGRILFPADPAAWLSALQGSGLLDRLPPTSEDKVRAEHYTQERERQAAAGTLSPEAYLASLGLVVTIRTPGPADMPRLAQLVAKTNQFNVSCRRRDEAALAALCASDRHRVRLVAASDRFGDYGAIGVTILETTGSGLVLDTFLLSCRAMGRGIETAMAADLLEAGPVTATNEVHTRNAPARRFLASLGVPEGETGRLAPCEWPRHIHQEVPA